MPTNAAIGSRRRRLAAACVLWAVSGLSAVTAQPARHDEPHPQAAAALQHVQVADPASGRVYELLLSQPDKPAPAAGYAVVYLFDGNRSAPKALAWLRAHDLADRVLVVGLGYPDTADFDVARRYQDLTPTAAPDHPGSGQAGAFLDFIETQVKPRIARRYRIDPARTALFGHSLGGLTVLYALTRNPARYSAYFAASPSLWWHDGDLIAPLRQRAQRDDCGAGQRRDVVITVGREEQPLDQTPTDPPERRAKLARRRMVDNAAAAADILGGCVAFDIDYQILPGADHGAALPAGLYHALAHWLDKDSAAPMP
ncbi:hydrolase of alpha/beta superfamily protein [Salinisphaera sp. S4-8]|uniref:alpha/beta hydrolase n=1 Tax=Salinisphaera sp. S4-8 TaxID=633357 RepID=UPI00334145E8